MPGVSRSEEQEWGGRGARRRAVRGLGGPRLERLQRGQAVLGRLPGAGAARGRAARAGPAGPLGLALLGRSRSRLRAVALLVPAARAGAAVARRAARVPLLEPWRARRAARRRARRLRLLHGRRLGLALLPPAHRRAVDERAALLAAGAHELGPHERQRARAGAEAADGAERRQRCWRRSRARARCAADRRSRRRSPPRLGALAWRARSRDAAAALPGARRAARAAGAGRSPGAST